MSFTSRNRLAMGNYRFKPSVLWDQPGAIFLSFLFRFTPADFHKTSLYFKVKEHILCHLVKLCPMPSFTALLGRVSGIPPRQRSHTCGYRTKRAGVGDPLPSVHLTSQAETASLAPHPMDAGQRSLSFLFKSADLVSSHSPHTGRDQ